MFPIHKRAIKHLRSALYFFPFKSNRNRGEHIPVCWSVRFLFLLCLHIRQQNLSRALSFPVVKLLRIGLLLIRSWLTSGGELLLQVGDLEWFQIKMSIDRLEEERGLKDMRFICFQPRKMWFPMYPCAHGSDEKYHPRWRRSTAPPIKALSVKKSIELIFAQLDIFGLLLPWANSCQELPKVAKNWKELWRVYQQVDKIPSSCPNLPTNNGILKTPDGAVK